MNFRTPPLLALRSIRHPTASALSPYLEFPMQDIVKEMKLQDLKVKTPTELLSFAEEVGVENASAMRKQELMFAILKQLAAKETDIIGTGVVEVLQDGFGFLRSPDANYLPGPDDIYVSPSQIRRFALAYRRYGRRPDPQPQGGRALLRAAQGQHASTSRTPRSSATRCTSTTSRRSIRPSG